MVIETVVSSEPGRFGKTDNHLESGSEKKSSFPKLGLYLRKNC